LKSFTRLIASGQKSWSQASRHLRNLNEFVGGKGKI
jgi:hypothetical protein